MFAFATRIPKKKSTPSPGKEPGTMRSWKNPLGGGSFMSNLLVTILLFLFLMSGYSLISQLFVQVPEIPLSAVAADVAAEKIATIIVSTDTLDLTYADGSHKASRKDPSAGLPETLATYGVTPEELAKVAITVKGQSGL